MTRSRERLLLFLIVLLAFGLRLYRLTYPLADWHSFRQADTASVAREYVKNGIDLLRPRYHDLSHIQSGLDNLQGFRMVEFPLIGALVASTYPTVQTLFHIDLHVWYRLTSILFSLVSLLLLYRLAQRLFSISVALITVLVYAVLPFNIYYGRSLLPEVPLITSYLLSLYSAWRYGEKPAWVWFILMVLGGALALLLKPTAIFMLVPILIPAIRSIRRSPSQVFTWMVGAIFMVVPLYLWRQWISHFPEGIPASAWLLNGNNLRFSPAWFRWLFFERFTKLFHGYFGVIFFMAGFWTVIKPLILQPIKLWTQDRRFLPHLFVLVWILGALAFLVIFASGNVQHDYYQVVLVPLVCLMVALGLHYFWQKPFRATNGLVLVICGLSLGLAWQAVRGYFNVNHWEIVQAGQAIDRLVPPDALVIAPYKGDTAFLYQTNRRGWPQGLHIDKNIAFGADYYVTIKFDDEARALESQYPTVQKTDDYLILSLNP